jgi:hypothetical protein
MSKKKRLKDIKCGSGTAAMSKTEWKKLLESALATEEYEIGCEECYDVLDLYVDLLMEHADPTEVMPTVKQHLNQCKCCARELEAILIMLDEAVPRDDGEL